MDCGGTFPVCAMEFDHVRGQKKFNVPRRGRSYRAAYPAVQAELAKCDVVCANCHSIRTDRRKTEMAELAEV